MRVLPGQCRKSIFDALNQDVHLKSDIVTKWCLRLSSDVLMGNGWSYQNAKPTARFAVIVHVKIVRARALPVGPIATTKYAGSTRKRSRIRVS